MNVYKTARNLIVTTLALGAVATGTASASGSSAPRCRWVTVTVHETVQEPCVHYVTKYDHCGRPYVARIVTYKSVRVPVSKRVQVCY